MCSDKIGTAESCRTEIFEMKHNSGSEKVDCLAGFSSSGGLSGEELLNLKPNCGAQVVEEENGGELFLIRAPFTACEVEVCPATPSPDSENFGLLSSSDHSADGVVLDCQTPKRCIFDSFASGPGELVSPPKLKMPKEVLISLKRRLNFELLDGSPEKVKAYDSEGALEEDVIVELICNSLLELIISIQLPELAADWLPGQHVHAEGLKTPTSWPLLTGVAETCPPAPARHKVRSKAFMHGICRKIEFGTDLD